MERIKLIRKLAIPASIIFVVSIVVLLTQFPYRNIQSQKRAEQLANHVNTLIQQYQGYLTQTAAKISSLPVDQKIISETQSKILQESQQIDLFVWMIDNQGDFVF